MTIAGLPHYFGASMIPIYYLCYSSDANLNVTEKARLGKTGS